MKTIKYQVCNLCGRRYTETEYGVLNPIYVEGVPTDRACPGNEGKCNSLLFHEVIEEANQDRLWAEELIAELRALSPTGLEHARMHGHASARIKALDAA